MEHQVVKRRISMVLHHVSNGVEFMPSNSPHLFPLNCSSALNSMMHHCGNRLLFARQGSASRAFHMQPVSFSQSNECGHSSNQSSQPNCYSSGDRTSSAAALLHSRQAQTYSAISYGISEQLMKQDSQSAIEAPKFARPLAEKNENKELSFSRIKPTVISSEESHTGTEWVPRVDVAESASSYAVIVELPGVNISDHTSEGRRAKIDSLSVTGERSAKQWIMATVSEDVAPMYHRREISQGPNRVVWPLPSDERISPYDSPQTQKHMIPGCIGSKTKSIDIR